MKFVLNKIKSVSWTVLLLFLIGGWFNPIIGLAALFCMAAPVVYGIIKGNRRWCSFYCPRGAFNDIILSNLSRKVKHPKLFNNNVFKAGFFVFLMFNFVSGVVTAWPDPVLVGKVFVRMVSITTAITIILGVVFHQRTWCVICPMGYLASKAVKKRKQRYKVADVLD